MLPEIQYFPQTANKMTVTSIKYVFLHWWSAKSKTLPTNIGFVVGLGCLQRWKVSSYCKIDFRHRTQKIQAGSDENASSLWTIFLILYAAMQAPKGKKQ